MSSKYTKSPKRYNLKKVQNLLQIAAEAAVRLAVSHVLMPMHPADDIAQQAGWLLAGCLNAPVPASGPGPQTVKA